MGVADRLRRGRLVAGVLAIAVSACGTATRVESPEPAAPTGPIEAQGPAASGPVVELGKGQVLDRGWRYGIYPSDEGWCTQVELGGVASTGCGDLVPSGDAAFGGVGRSEPSGDGPGYVQGLASADTATVWLIEDRGRGRRLPATLFPLDEAGLEAQAFVGFTPPDMNVTHVMAVALNGRVLETYELP